MISKLKKITLITFSLMLVRSITPDYFFSPAFAFEVLTNGKLLGEVDDQIKNVKAHKSVVPNDSYYSTQLDYSMNNIGNIQSVWDTYTGKGTTIAVIDDGFDHDHPEYTRSDGTSVISNDSAYFYQYRSGSSYYVGVKYYKNDKTCIDEDYEGSDYGWATHGTNTSSTALAPIGNDGIVGIAPDATLLALKIDMSFSAIEKAIEYAIEKKVDVINMSLGAFAESFYDGFNDYQEGYSSTATYLNSVCEKAYKNNIIVVASAGNEATYYKSYPACNSHVIGVGALYKNSNDVLAPFTNYVSPSQSGEVNVDILAPGYVWAAGINGRNSTTHYATFDNTQGTSFSSPIVAGAAALWKEKNPNGTVDEFVEQLQESADGIGEYKNKYIPVSKYENYSYDVGPSNLEVGRLNVYSLLNYSTEITGISLSKNEINLNYGSGTTSSKIVATVLPKSAENKNVNWTISNPNIVSLSSSSSLSGEEITITSLGYGECDINASTFDNSFSATCHVKISEFIEISSLSLTDKDGDVSSSLQKGETIQLYPSILPSNASNSDFIVASENESIVTVDDNYLAKAINIGETDIVMLAYLNDGSEISATYHISVTRMDGLSEIVFSLYDTSTLSDGSSSTAPTKSTFSNAVTVDGENCDDVVSSFTCSNVFARQGGVALSSNKNDGTFTLTLNNDYSIYEVEVVGVLITSTAFLKLNDNKGEGSLNSSGSTLSECNEILAFSSLNGTNTLKFDATNKLVIYKIICYGTTPKPVLCESISLLETSLKLDLIKNKTATLTATVLPTTASNKNIAFSSSDDNVASINNNGEVTAKGIGETIISVSTLDGSNLKATCKITVSEGIKVVSLSLQNGATSIPYMDEYDYSSLKAIVTYSDGSTSDVSSSLKHSSIDTSILGIQQIKGNYEENGFTVSDSFNVKVTNLGASKNVGESISESINSVDSTLFTTSSWGDKNNKWTSGKGGNDYLNNGVQVTKNSSGAYATTKSSLNDIYKIVVSYCTNSSSGKGSISMSINGTKYSNSVSSSGGLSTRESTFNFDSKVSGKVNINVTCSENSIYIKGIDIYMSSTKIIASYPASFLDQAKAYASYFLTQVNDACDPSGANSNVSMIADRWSDLKDEYTFMSDKAKDEFNNSSDATISKARSLYSLIYKKYHSSLNNDDFIISSDGTSLINDSVMFNSNLNTLILLIICITIPLLTIVLFFAYKSRRRID